MKKRRSKGKQRLRRRQPVPPAAVAAGPRRVVAGLEPPRQRDPVLGILFKTAAVFMFTIMSVCVKWTATEVPAGEAVFFRSALALIPVVGYLVWCGEFPAALKTRNIWGHVWRGGLGGVSMAMGFFALALLPLADSISIGYAMPLFATAFAALFLGEKVRAMRWGAILVGFSGVLVILWPKLAVLRGDGGSLSQAVGACVALGGALVVALALTVVRKLVRAERTTTIVFYFSALCTLGSFVSSPWWTVPSATGTLLLIGAGLVGGIGQLCLTESNRYADASTIAPFEYTSIIFSLAFGYWVFGELPTSWSLTGVGIVIAAGLFTLWREHSLHLAGRRGGTMKAGANAIGGLARG